MKKLVIFTGMILFVSTVFSQNPSTNPADSLGNSNNVLRNAENNSGQIYNRNRLGSSAPQYDSYEKNNYGAGSITTDPNKGSGVNMAPVKSPGDSAKTTIYSDLRLGSSSPLYNTYEKNNYGAGSVTTNPNKTGGGSPFQENSVPNLSYPTTDSTHIPNSDSSHIQPF